MVNFLHISDLHISNSLDETRVGKATTRELLKTVIELAQTLKPEPSFLVFSGDLTDKGDIESYEYFYSVISNSKFPCILALGNHDDRSNFHKVFFDSFSDNPYFHVSEHGNLKIIVLDSSQPGKVSGSICDDQFSFLDKALSSNDAHNTLLVMHHPPWLDTDSYPWTTLDQNSSLKLSKLLDEHSVCGILCGHIHLNQFTNWNTIPIVASSGLHSTIDTFENDELRLLEGASVNLCRLRGAQLSVTCLQIYPTAREIRRINKKFLLSMN